jgi:hypothetical protein
MQTATLSLLQYYTKRLIVASTARFILKNAERQIRKCTITFVLSKSKNIMVVLAIFLAILADGFSYNAGKGKGLFKD